jgi:hypothetical protein
MKPTITPADELPGTQTPPGKRSLATARVCVSLKSIAYPTHTAQDPANRLTGSRRPSCQLERIRLGNKELLSDAFGDSDQLRPGDLDILLVGGNREVSRSRIPTQT